MTAAFAMRVSILTFKSVTFDAAIRIDSRLKSSTGTNVTFVIGESSRTEYGISVTIK